jgi:predicted ABC-type transport system involved in lysophospholipase L1 biosynthesis ATPase subunit
MRGAAVVMNDLLVSVRELTKNYQALRPLRIQRLEVRRGAIVSLTGLDAQAGEMLVGLLTGAVLPDQGEVQLLGKSTHDVADSDAWLAMLDAVGIVTDRAVLIGQFSVEQNIAIPFTLQVDPLTEEVRPRVWHLAEEVGLGAAELQRPVGQSAPEVIARVHLARALALRPALLIAEHPSATLPRETVKAYGRDLARLARAREMAVLAITGDSVFSDALGGQTLTHEPSTGALHPPSAWRRIFG